MTRRPFFPGRRDRFAPLQVVLVVLVLAVGMVDKVSVEHLSKDKIVARFRLLIVYTHGQSGCLAKEGHGGVYAFDIVKHVPCGAEEVGVAGVEEGLGGVSDPRSQEGMLEDGASLVETGDCLAGWPEGASGHAPMRPACVAAIHLWEHTPHPVGGWPWRLVPVTDRFQDTVE